MGKKNKKQSQKKRQSKALKRRSEKKSIKKSLPKRRAQPPMNMPGGMATPPKNFIEFAEPLVAMIDPAKMGDMNAMNAMAALIQGFWKGYTEKDPAAREKVLASLQTIYEEQPWATVDFAEVAEFMLKRHIHYLPETHSEEERSRYSTEEIQAAVEGSLVEAADAEAPADALEVPEIDAGVIEQLLPEAELTALRQQHEELQQAHEQIDFLQPDHPLLGQLEDFHRKVTALFQRYLEHISLAPDDIAAYMANLNPLLNDYLVQTKQHSLLNLDEDLVEEYMLDYYFRKLETTPAAEDLLVDALGTFFSFVEKAGFIDTAEPLLERVAESREEYEELLQDQRETEADNGE